jgi:hypothetical protein
MAQVVKDLIYGILLTISIGFKNKTKILVDQSFSMQVKMVIFGNSTTTEGL